MTILANALCTQKGQFVVDWKVCILLKRLAYPCRYFDLIYTFARPVPELCLITNTLLDGMYNEHGFWLSSWNQPFFPPATLQEYSQAITRKGNPLTNCFWAHKRHCSSKLLLRGKTTCSLQWTQADPWSQIPICCPFKWANRKSLWPCRRLMTWCSNAERLWPVEHSRSRSLQPMGGGHVFLWWSCVLRLSSPYGPILRSPSTYTQLWRHSMKPWAL